MIADLVTRRMAEVHPDLKGARAEPSAMIVDLPRTVLSPGSAEEIGRINASIQTLSDEELGRTVRYAQKLLNRYADLSENPSAELMRSGATALQSAVVGLLRGGSSMALQGIKQEHERFDRDILLALNGEITVAKEEARRFVEEQRSDLDRLIVETREALEVEKARLQDTHAMALRGTEQAQVEATAARRQVEALQGQLDRITHEKDGEIERLKGLLASERAATVERDRTAGNDLEQARKDLRTAQQMIGHLNAECDRLTSETKALSADLEALTAPAPLSLEVSPMPTMPARQYPANALETASLCVYLRAHGIPATWTSVGVDHDGRMTDAHAEGWRGAYPTREAMLAQLRAVVLPMLERQVAA